MSEKRLSSRFLMALLVAVIFVGAVFVYLQKINVVAKNTVITNIEELTAHDVKNIEGHIIRTWTDLKNTAGRISEQEFESALKMQEYMSQERVLSNFDALYLVDEDGNIYSDIYTIMKPSEKNFEKLFEENPDGRFIAWNKDTTGLAEKKKTTLLYGITIEPMKVADVTFVAIVGQVKITDIKEQLQVESFGGNGNSRIVDQNGNYVVIPSVYMSTNSYDSIWDTFKDDYNLSSEDIAEARSSFNNGEEFYIEYEDHSGNQMFMFFHPMEISGVSGWYFITQVSEKVFNEQTHTLFVLNIIQMIIVVIMTIAFVIILVVSHEETVRSRVITRAKSQFLSNMSHEIRTPLNGIIGLSYQISQHINEPEKIQSYSKKLNEVSAYLLSLVNDVLDMSKIQAGKINLECEPLSVDELVDSVCDIQADNIKQKDISFYVEKKLDKPYIMGDEVRIKQVLMNLLSNAVKFTSAGGKVTFTVEQETLDEENVETTFMISDTGCGISREFQKHIFEDFSQERNRIHTSQKGTGLGLAISYRLMKHMGGDLSVESEIGKGSTFRAELPAKITTGIKKSGGNAELHTSDNSKLFHILVVEDNDINADMMVDILKESGYIADRAKNGLEAVEIFEKSPLYSYNLILMDVQMPVMDGYEATRKIRALKREDAGKIKIFACTAHSTKEEMENVLSTGMDDFLSKPIDVEKVLGKIKELWEGGI